MDTLEKQFSDNEIYRPHNPDFVKNGYEEIQTWLLDSEKSKIAFSEKLGNPDYFKGCILAIYNIIENGSDHPSRFGKRTENLKIKTITFSHLEEINRFVSQQHLFFNAMKKLGYEYRVHTGNPQCPLLEFVKRVKENKNREPILQNFVSILNKVTLCKYLKETIGRYTSKSNKTKKFTEEDRPFQF